MIADEDYDGLPPDGWLEEQARAEEERQRLISHHICVDHTVHLFADAANGDATALSFAIATVQRHALAKKELRLSVNDRDRLLDVTMQARGAILALIQDRHGNARLPFAASAVDAVAALIVMWSENEPWNDRPRELRNDVHTRALWLRQEA
ncbi:hypothetical protein [Pseudorhizobium pelagicum]|uniref:Uncharacterized protein n=1 Tax=Pseudorhizobium pelagicum TaxID=1509405 RepID=A0A922P242_9HYPH|nr:hypothetical protein [Pseudorhizobium pelagicum]KEQ07512.1 hypothetical protein GV67_22425 [Pseudorhizobium pelagicum]KEQ09110.1 hypothetical protein GV68_25445 [Pseudorhizobium pelagicum]